MFTREKKYNLVLFFILILGFFLRIYDLGRYGLWFDEAVSVFGAKLLTFESIKNFGTFFTNLPFVYPPLLKLWLFFSDSDYFLRLFSVLFGVLSILLIYILAKKIIGKSSGKQTALSSAFLLSISPLHIHYSREITQYSIAFFFSLCSLYFFLKCIERCSLKNNVLFVFSSLLCVYIHSFFVVFLLAELLYILILKGNSFKRCMVNFLMIFLFCIPFIIFGFIQFRNIIGSRMLTWAPESSLLKVAALFNTFNIGYNSGSAFYGIAFAVFTFFFILGVWKGRNIIKNFKPLVVLFIFPILFGFVLSKFIPSFIYRYFIFSLPLYLIFVSYGIVSLKKSNLIRFVFILCLLLTNFVALKNLYGNIFPLPEDTFRPGIHKGQPYRKAALYIQNRYEFGDLIGHTCASTWIPFMYYHNYGLYPDQYETFNAILSFGKLKDNYSVIINYFADIYEQKDKDLIARGRKYAGLDISNIPGAFKRVWLVYSYWEKDGSCQLCQIIRKQMLANYELVNQVNFGDIEIYLFNVDRGK